MHTEIEEVFEIQAPIERVWAFLMDPRRVVACMPGAELEQVTDDDTFLGSIQLKLGFVSVRYRIEARFTDVDGAAYTARLVAEGSESKGASGSASGTMQSQLCALPAGGTRVTVVVAMSLSGRLVEFGRGMIRSVCRQLTRKFVSCAKRNLEQVAPA